MSSQVKFTDHIAGESIQAQGAAQSDDALKASLAQLTEVIELFLEAQAEEGASTSAKTKGEVAEDLLNRVGPLLSQYMAEDPVQAQKLVASLAPLLVEYANSSKEATEKVTRALQPVIVQFLAKNPGHEMEVMQILAPLIREAGGDKAALQMVAALKGAIEMNEALKGPNGPAIAKELQETAVQLSNTKVDVAEALLESLMPTLRKLDAKDPSKMQHFLNHLVPLLGMYALHSPLKAKTLPLEELYDLPFDQMDNRFNQLKSDACQAPGDQNTPGLNNLMGMAMFFLQQFQWGMSKSQATQDKLQTQAGAAMVKSALVAQQDVVTKLNEIDAARAAANSRPWWEKLIEWTATAVGGVLAFLATGGLAAPLLAVLMGVFMASGLSDTCVSGIATAIVQAKYNDYYNDYRAEGKSDADAKQLATEKAQSAGNIIGKLVVMAAILLISAGVAGVSIGLSAGATQGAEVGAVEGAEVGAEEGAQQGIAASMRSGLSRLSMSWNPLSTASCKIALSQALQSLATSNIWLDCFRMDPEWADKHQALVLALDAIAEIVTVALSMGLGVSGAKDKMAELGGANMISQFSSLADKAGLFLLIGTGVQATGSGVQAVSSGIRAEILSQLAGDYDQVADLQKDLQIAIGSNSMMQFTTKGWNAAASNILEATGDEMQALNQNAAGTWSQADKILRKTS